MCVVHKFHANLYISIDIYNTRLSVQKKVLQEESEEACKEGLLKGNKFSTPKLLSLRLRQTIYE
jgi:hypothetical protein